MSQSFREMNRLAREVAGLDQCCLTYCVAGCPRYF